MGKRGGRLNRQEECSVYSEDRVEGGAQHTTKRYRR